MGRKSLPWCVREPATGLWHACVRGKGDSWFQPIVCGLGINLPGNHVRREPDCPDCIAFRRGAVIGLSELSGADLAHG